MRVGAPPGESHRIRSWPVTNREAKPLSSSKRRITKAWPPNINNSQPTIRNTLMSWASLTPSASHIGADAERLEHLAPFSGAGRDPPARANKIRRDRPVVTLLCVTGGANRPKVGECMRAALTDRFHVIYLLGLRSDKATTPRHTLLIEKEGYGHRLSAVGTTEQPERGQERPAHS